jgi:hypothetical protein
MRQKINDPLGKRKRDWNLTGYYSKQ